MPKTPQETNCTACASSPCVCRQSCTHTKGGGLGCVMKVVAVAGLIGWYCWVDNTIKSRTSQNIRISVDVEKESKSDFVIWRLGFQNSGADIKLLQEKFNKDRDLILAFLKGKGFSDAEISIAGPRMTDQYAKGQGKEYGVSIVNEKTPESSRYVIGSRIKVITNNVEAVTQAVKEVDSLIKEGVILVHSESEANPRYYLKDQTKLEQELNAEICTKAKVLAEEIAKGMGVKLGNIQSVSNYQPVEILGQGQAGRGGGWDGRNERLRGPVKIARLQQQFEFLIH